MKCVSDGLVEVLGEASVSDAGGIVSEHVDRRIDDTHRHHLPIGRQHYIQAPDKRASFLHRCIGKVV